MSIFICTKCKCLENTAPSGYWYRDDKPALCTKCDPEFGKWHGIFKRKKATEKDRNRVLNPEELKRKK